MHANEICRIAFLGHHIDKAALHKREKLINHGPRTLWKPCL